MRHNEGKFTGFGGMELFTQSWLPDEAPKATVVLTHGLGEHSGRYPHVVNYLVPRGYAIYSFDHRGHGRSAAKLCAHVNDWAEYRSDVHAFLQMVRRQTAGEPLFLMGHSMGGLIALNYALHHPEGLQGVIASAPAVGVVDANPLLLLIGRILSKIKPDFAVDSQLDANAISRDPATVRTYVEDPLVSGKVSARWSTEFTGAIDWTRDHASDFQPPLLIIHGSADSLVPPEGSRIFFEKAPHADKKRIVYEGGYHENHNDIHYEQVTADLEQWLEAHL
ncbi:MAG: alpha/beta hydrolase [Chloroflexi bacterium]|nr:alpha/beta hydrolase [Chloroflexota bacterium]